MDIKELKTLIESNNLKDSPLIFKYDDNKFLCYQYADAIAKNKNLKKLFISSLNEIHQDDIFEAENLYLYIYDVDKLEETVKENYKNLIVICKEIKSECEIDFIDFPKPVNWQIEDYVKFRLPGLATDQIKWLCEIAKYDIYRLELECNKLSIFQTSLQKVIFDEMNNENAYCDLNSLTIFNFTNAIISKDLVTIDSVLQNIDYIDIEPTGVCTILLQNFKKLIEVGFSTQWNQSMKVSEKQYNYYRFNLLKLYSRESLIKIYEFLTEIDYKLKSGYIDNKYLVSYIINNILVM